MESRLNSQFLACSLLIALALLPGMPAQDEAGDGKGRAAAGKQKPVAPPSDEFCLRSGPGGRLHLLTYETENTRFALRIRGDSGFGEPRYLQSPLGPKETPDWFELQIGPDGSAHLFVMRSGDRESAGYLFAYLPPEKEAKKKAPEGKVQSSKPAWVPLSGGAPPGASWSRPEIVPQKNGALEVFSEVLLMKKDTLEGRKLVRGLLERGRYRATGSLDLDKGPFQEISVPKFIALPNGEPVAFFMGAKGMAWTLLKKFQPVAACPTPAGGVLEGGTLLVLNRKGIAHAALPESIEDLRGAKGKEMESGYRYRLARGKPLAALEALGLLPDRFPLPNAVLAATPDGRTWLAGVPGRTQDLHPVALWDLSGKFPPKPAVMPFAAAPHRLDAAVSGDDLWLAFGVEEGICVEKAVLPGAAGE